MPDDLNDQERRARANAAKTVREEHERALAAMKTKWGEVLRVASVLIGIFAYACWSEISRPPCLTLRPA